MVPWAGLRCVIVVFPDHTHLFFVTYKTTEKIIFLMNHMRMQPIVASTIHDMIYI